MSLSFEINAETRQDVGKGASRRLRKANKVPAILYGAGKPPQSLVLDQDVTLRNLAEEGFYSHILTVNFDGNSEQAVLKAVQRHPFKAQVMHVDLQRTSATQKLHMHVPLHFIGQEVAPGVKQGGLVSHHLIEVEIECLPKDLPEFIEVDVSQLDLNGLVHVSDLVLPAGVVIPALAQGEEHDQVVASVHMVHGGADEEAEDAEGAAADETGL
jgi:large subunit ribosomal protein L25